MKIALEVNGQRFEAENEHCVFWAIEQAMRDANLLDDGDSMEILSSEQRYVIDKSGL